MSIPVSPKPNLHESCLAKPDDEVLAQEVPDQVNPQPRAVPEGLLGAKEEVDVNLVSQLKEAGLAEVLLQHQSVQVKFELS